MKRCVLVVDDEEAILSFLGLAFDQAGMAFVTAQSVEEAVDAMTKRAFDAVVVDKNLSGTNGLDLVRWIRDRNRKVPILMMTAFPTHESAVEGLNLGIDAYLEKPFASGRDVPETVRALVDGGRSGWLPEHTDLQAQAARESVRSADGGLANPATAARPLRILVGSSNEGSSMIGGPALESAPAGSVLAPRETLGQLVVALADVPKPDLLILDADHFLTLVRVVAALRDRAKLLTIVVVTSRALPVSVLQALVHYGVTQLVDRASGDYAPQIARVVRGVV